MGDIRCPGCDDVIDDDDTIEHTVSGVTWHAGCKALYDNRRERMFRAKMNEHDLAPDHWARASAAAGAKPVLFERTDDPRPIRFPPPTINYTITPQRFVLDIPVEALAGLHPDAHTRMLAMLNAWITEHKPKPLYKSQQEKKP